MKKIIPFIIVLCSLLVIGNNIVLADEGIPEFETVANIINSNGATTYEISTNELAYTNDDTNNNENVDTSTEETNTNDNSSELTNNDTNLPVVVATDTIIPFNAVVYGDSVSSAPIAKTVLLKSEIGGENQRLSMYQIKYNDNKYLVSTNDVSQFKLIDTEIVDTNPVNQTNEDNNPTTGMIEVIITWLVAGLSITFSFYYFIRYTKMR